MSVGAMGVLLIRNPANSGAVLAVQSSTRSIGGHFGVL